VSGDWHQWKGGGDRERIRRVNMLEIYVLMNENGKMRSTEMVPGMGEWG
jgi:hypothetical protein